MRKIIKIVKIKKIKILHIFEIFGFWRPDPGFSAEFRKTLEKMIVLRAQTELGDHPQHG